MWQLNFLFLFPFLLSTYYNHSFSVGAIISSFSSNSLVVRYVLNAMSPQFFPFYYSYPFNQKKKKTIPTHPQQIIQVMLSAIFLNLLLSDIQVCSSCESLIPK